MEETTSEKPKKGMSGFSAVEIAISCLIFASFFMPLGTTEFMGTGKEKIIFFFQFLSENSPVWLYLSFVLPVINVIVKQFYRTSWLSLLTIYAAYMPIMAIDSMGSDVWIQVKPSFGYYLQWANIFLMGVSILISWLVFWGKKCTNYKRLFVISGTMIVGGIVVGLILIKLLDAAVLGAFVFSLNLLGIPLLIVAIISFFINHKKGTEISTSNENVKAEVSNALSAWLNKKTGIVAGGALLIILLVVGLFKCSGTENHFEVKVPTWEKFIMVTAEDVNLRKEPNVNSEKLMIEDLSVPETDMIGYRQFWSDMKSTKNIYPFHLEKDYTICPVISETDDWYQIYVYNEYWSKAETAYIMKKFCKEVIPDRLNKEIIASINNSRFGAYYKFPFSGKYKGYCIHAIPEGMDIRPELKIGKIVNNVIVYPTFEDDVLVGHYSGDDANVDFVQNESYNASFSEEYMLEYGCVNPKKLNEEQIERIFGTLVKGKQGSLVLLEYSFNGEIKYYMVDLNKYEYQLVTK